MAGRDSDWTDGRHAGADQAREIYQTVIDTLNGIYEALDLDALSRTMHLPLPVATFGHRVVLQTPSDLRHLMFGIRRFLDQKSVTTYLRVCIEAQFRDPDTIEGVHESHILNGMRYVEPVMPVRCVLRRIDGLWKVTDSETAMEDDSELAKMLYREFGEPAVWNKPPADT